MEEHDALVALGMAIIDCVNPADERMVMPLVKAISDLIDTRLESTVKTMRRLSAETPT